MNYYNPYYFTYPFIQSAPKVGLFSRIFGGINLNSILNGTQRTLNIINQGIPLIKQVKPVISNAKTMFRVMNEFKKAETPIDKNNVDNEVINEIDSTNSPTFFA